MVLTTRAYGLILKPVSLLVIAGCPSWIFRPAGHQPMFSSTGRFVISYNGEIYNCERLRHELLRETPGLCFQGHSDTEVMLAAFERWGIESSLERMNGMFAFALWDRHERALYLGRDRFGEKPMYYGSVGEMFLFASELKALRGHPAFDAEIDRDALACYLQFNCIPAPYSSLQVVSANCFPEPFFATGMAISATGLSGRYAHAWNTRHRNSFRVRKKRRGRTRLASARCGEAAHACGCSAWRISFGRN